jgi:hypothetical protein
MPTRSDENKTTRRIFLGLRAAAEALYGPRGLDAILAKLPSEAREQTTDAALLSEWIPSRFIYDWLFAAWEGPVKKDQQRFEQYVRAVVEHGVNRFYRPVLDLVSADRITASMVAQYRRDNQRGSLKAEKRDYGARLIFGDFGFDPTPFNQMAAATFFKCGVQLSRMKHIEVVHAMLPNGDLQIDLAWKLTTPSG